MAKTYPEQPAAELTSQPSKLDALLAAAEKELKDPKFKTYHSVDELFSDLNQDQEQA